jgi:flagellar hook-associated protein 2
VKAWIDLVSSSSINEAKQLVLNNGATYSSNQSGVEINTPITGETGSPSDLAGFQDGDTFKFTTSGGIEFETIVNSSTTIGDLQLWISETLPASTIESTLDNEHTLVLNDENASYSHSVLGLGSPLKRPIVIAAQDAAFTLDGIDYTRTSNTVTDALSGITINLIKSDTTSQSISVNKGADKTPQVIQGLVDSYNDLVATAKKLSAKSSPSSTASTDGSLANSPTALSFLSQIKAMLVGDIHYSLAGTDGTLSLGDLGFEMQFDGTVKFNQTTLNGTKNASAILASGIQVGYATYVERDPDTGEIVSKVTTDVTLDSYLNSLLKATKSDEGAIAGAFDRMIANERSSLSEMNKKQTSLQIRLDEKQKSLYSQYSALNALLFKLSNTSNSLTNALSGLTNGQNNN